MKPFGRLGIFILVIMLVMSVSLVGCGGNKTVPLPSAPDESLDPIKIGIAVPITGPLAHMGIDLKEGIEVAVERINEKGGINGRLVEYFVGDTPNPSAAVGETERLIQIENVVAILGGYGSTNSAAVSEVSARYGIPYLECVSIGSVITNRDYKYIFRFSPTDVNFAQVATKAIVELVPEALGKAKEDLIIAIGHEDGLYGSSYTKNLLIELEKVGLKNNVVAVEPYSNTATDLSSLVLKFKQLSPDVLVMTSYENDAVLFIRQSIEQGFDVPIFLGSGAGYGQPGFVEALGSYADGVLNLEYPSLPPYINKDAVPGIDEYIKYYKQVFNAEPKGVYPHVGYAAANILFEAIGNADSTDAEAIASALYEIDIEWWQTTAGWGAKFTDNYPIDGHRGQNERASVYLTQWKDSKLYVVWPEEGQAMEPLLPKPKW